MSPMPDIPEGFYSVDPRMEGLVKVKLGGQDVSVHQSLAESLKKADADMRKTTGNGLKIASSFRTREKQQQLYDELHPKGAAVAKPGTSRHEKGLALDVANWQVASPYLKKYGLDNPIKGDANHFQLADKPKSTPISAARNMVADASGRIVPPNPDIPEQNRQYVKPGSKSFYTELKPEQEKQFRTWMKENKVPPYFPDEPADSERNRGYDMRGFWKGLQDKDPHAEMGVDPNDGKVHTSDYWKTPYHPTFSKQSQYATPDAPNWNDKDQLIDKNGKVLFDDRAQSKRDPAWDLLQQDRQKGQPVASGRTVPPTPEGFAPANQAQKSLPPIPEGFVLATPGQETPQPQDQPKQGAQGQPEQTEKPGFLKRAAKAVAPYARPLLEYGGMTVGGVAGGAAGGAAGSIVPFAGTAAGASTGGAAGAGLGYAAGRQAANALDEYAGIKKPEDAGKAVAQAGMDVLFGATSEMGGQALSKFVAEPVAQWVGSKLGNAAKGLYQSALKPSTVYRKQAQGAIQTGIEGKYWVNEKSLDRITSDRASLAKDLDQVVTRGEKLGAKVKVDDIADQVSKLKEKYKGLDMADQHADIDSRIDLFRQRADADGYISAKDAHQLKQNIQRDLTDMAWLKDTRAAVKKADKAIAHEINEQLKVALPEYGKINEELSKKINLTKYLERAVSRVRNHNVIGLGDMITLGSAFTGGAAAGGAEAGGALAVGALITKKVLESPMVKSRLAYALARSARITGKSLTQPISFGLTKGAEKAAGSGQESPISTP